MGVRSQQGDKRWSEWEESEEEGGGAEEEVLGSRSALPSHSTRDGREQLGRVATQQETQFASHRERDAVVWNVWNPWNVETGWKKSLTLVTHVAAVR